MSHPSNGQKCTRCPSRSRMKRSQGIPASGGFRRRSLHVEMKDRLRAACALLVQVPPAGISHARSTVAADALANEVDVDASSVGQWRWKSSSKVG